MYNTSSKGCTKQNSSKAAEQSNSNTNFNEAKNKLKQSKQILVTLQPKGEM
jgi:hypothetical protein